ncbi:MAG: sigma-70 family RNA polymerase sigma factor, partial [Myxococcota bacterium]
MPNLSEWYRAHRPEAQADAELEGALSRAVAQAVRFSVDPQRMVEALAGLDSLAPKVSSDAVLELALALGCVEGDAEALAVWERDYFPVVLAALRSMKLDEATAEDIAQEVRSKLLLSEDGSPKLVGYAGRGSLRGLLKVIATRTAISHLRRHEKESADAEFEAIGDSDPELAFLKERYRAAFRRSFEEAVATLSVRERNLLRLHFLQKMTLEALATMYGVHRATVVRHLAQARAKVDAETTRGMRTQLRIDPHELESVMNLIRSRF